MNREICLRQAFVGVYTLRRSSPPKLCLFCQEEKRRSAGPSTEIIKGGGSTTERDIQRVENRLQQVGCDVSRSCLTLQALRQMIRNIGLRSLSAAGLQVVANFFTAVRMTHRPTAHSPPLEPKKSDEAKTSTPERGEFSAMIAFFV